MEAIYPQNIANLRNRAIIGIMGYAKAPVGIVIAMRVRDYYSLGNRRCVRLHENGIERQEIVPRRLEQYIDAYLEAAGIANAVWSPLFRSTLVGAHQHVRSHPVRVSQVVSMINAHLHQQLPQLLP
jgi:hypothetical protein